VGAQDDDTGDHGAEQQRGKRDRNDSSSLLDPHRPRTRSRGRLFQRGTVLPFSARRVRELRSYHFSSPQYVPSNRPLMTTCLSL
jgi:hypothetical protein